MTHVTRYETRNGKTRRVKDTKSAPSGAPEKPAVPEPKSGTEKNQTPDRPAKGA